MEEISVVGVFDGKTIVVGNLTTETVYKINEYCIALADMSEAQAASFKGKKVLVTGKLKIVVGKYRPTKTSTDGKIYEPYKEPDKKFIVRPTFKVIE